MLATDTLIYSNVLLESYKYKYKFIHCQLSMIFDVLDVTTINLQPVQFQKNKKEKE